MVGDNRDQHTEQAGPSTVGCTLCGAKPTIGIDFMPVYNWGTERVPDKFKYTYRFCNLHFLIAYHAFYISTSVEWEINYCSSNHKEVREIVADRFRLPSEANNGHSDGDSVVRDNGGVRIVSVRDAWSDNRASDTRSWKKGGKAK